jgi:tRNA (guanine37-N1)-methyltransferase
LSSHPQEKLLVHIPPEKLKHIYNSLDLIGDIAIIKVADDGVTDAEAVAKQIMAVHKNVNTVFLQTSPIAGDFRVRELKLLAGEVKTIAKYRESGCVFAVDVEKCYFSPRLSYERARIARLVESGETVVNMFAGVGCFSIIIAKIVPQTQVFSIDINPTAFHFMGENVRVNRVFGKVAPLLGDAKDLIKTQLLGKADRVLMPLPEKALEYLPYAVSSLKASGGWIHFHDFQHAAGEESPVDKTKHKVAQKLAALDIGYRFVFSRVVRSTGPNWFQTVLDIQVTDVPNKFL